MAVKVSSKFIVIMFRSMILQIQEKIKTDHK